MDPDRIDEIEFQGSKAFRITWRGTELQMVWGSRMALGQSKEQGCMTLEQLKRFDEASSHPYECECDICKEWWNLVPPEDDEDE